MDSTEFWDLINSGEDAELECKLAGKGKVPKEIDSKKILKIVVPRAMRQQKPVYVGQNPYTGSYRRNFEEDYRCSQGEVRHMIAEQSSSSQDSQMLTDFDLKDLSIESFKSYRRRFANLKPVSTWNELDDINFLSRIGGWGKIRKTGEEGLTVAGLLTFGEERSIADYFPHYFLDYREKLSDVPGERWSNRG